MDLTTDSTQKARVRLERIPSQPDASLTLREFIQPYFPFNWHYHPEAELTSIVRGRGLRFVGDSIENYREGDLCLIGPSLPHFWQSPDNGCSVHSIVVQFHISIFETALRACPESHKLNHLLHQRSRRGLCISEKPARQITKLMKKMAAEKAGSMRRVVQLMDCLERIADCSESFARPISTTQMLVQDNHQEAGQLRKVLDRLDASLGDVLPHQSDLAQMLGITPAAFSRLFKRVLGKNYIDYLNEWRVGLACRRLIESDDPIIDVALAAGFENLSNFHRRFMAIKGMTPGQFRAKAKP